MCDVFVYSRPVPSTPPSPVPQSKHLKGQLGTLVSDEKCMSVKFLLIPTLPPSTELSAGGTKQNVKNTPNCILARRSSLGLAGRRSALAYYHKILIGTARAETDCDTLPVQRRSSVVRHCFCSPVGTSLYPFEKFSPGILYVMFILPIVG